MNVKCRTRINILRQKDENGRGVAIVSSTVEMNISYVRIIFDNYEVKNEFSNECKITFLMNNEIVAIVCVERDKVHNENFQKNSDRLCA
ncbi:MAG: hypothetical protein PHD41_07505 [Methanosarcinaceae archaeon]|nr:hypothetical protein [Methanosarcinaceae archaeon]